jgi:hypothetical protein
MRPGVKFNPKKSELLEVITKKHGYITVVAKEFDIHHQTLYDYMERNPDVKAHLEKVRNNKYENMMDSAESTIQSYCNNEKYPSLRMRAAEFVIRGRGYKRGWGLSNQEQDERVVVQDKIADNIKVVYKEIE